MPDDERLDDPDPLPLDPDDPDPDPDPDVPVGVAWDVPLLEPVIVELDPPT